MIIIILVESIARFVKFIGVSESEVISVIFSNINENLFDRVGDGVCQLFKVGNVCILDVPCNSGALSSWLSEFGPVQKVTINEIRLCRRSCLVLPGGNNPQVFIGCEHAIHEALENQNKLFDVVEVSIF